MRVTPTEIARNERVAQIANHYKWHALGRWRNAFKFVFVYVETRVYRAGLDRIVKEMRAMGDRSLDSRAKRVFEHSADPLRTGFPVRDVQEDSPLGDSQMVRLV
jgi:hypothetical protein